MFARVHDFDRMFGALDLIRHPAGGFLPGGIVANRSGEPESPLTNIYDKGDSFEVKVEVAGLDKSDLAISLQGDVLQIQGKLVCGPPEGFEVQRQERKNLNFSRQYRLPADVNLDGVQATLAEGFLVVNLPKAEAARVKEITIN